MMSKLYEYKKIFESMFRVASISESELEYYDELAAERDVDLLDKIVDQRMPIEIQKRLMDGAFENENDRVLAILARNPYIHPVIQRELYDYGDSYIWSYLIKNPNLDSTVQELIADSDISSGLMEWMARSDRLSGKAQAILANSGDDEVLALLADREDLTPEAREIIIGFKGTPTWD